MTLFSVVLLLYQAHSLGDPDGTLEVTRIEPALSPESPLWLPDSSLGFIEEKRFEGREEVAFEASLTDSLDTRGWRFAENLSQVEKSKGPWFSIEAFGRLSLLDGDVTHKTQTTTIVTVPGLGLSVDYTRQPIHYQNLFPIGYGFSLEGDLWRTLPVKKPPGPWARPDWSMFVSLTWDAFRGASTTDGFGDLIRAKDWNVATGLLGVKLLEAHETGLYAEVRAGLGAVWYGSVKADFILQGTTGSGELIAETVGVASELGGRVGYRSGRFAVLLGAGLRIMQGPDRGKDVTSYVSPDTLLQWGFDIGFEYHF